MEFKHEKNRIFSEDESGRKVAEVTFPALSEHMVNINHTYVDNSLRGQGVADELLRACTDELRAGGKQAVATCSYAKRWFGAHPECHDLLNDAQRKLMEEEKANSGE